MTEVTLTREELERITGYRAATKQLNILHSRGFVRAFIGRAGVVLERAHYDAVCRGLQVTEYAQQPTPAVNLSFLRKTGQR